MSNEGLKQYNDRQEGISLLRRYYKLQVAFGIPFAQIDVELVTAMDAVVHEFRTQFDVPGVRYWEYRPGPQLPLWFTTAAGEQIPAKYPSHECVELSRDEYLGRQRIFNYEDDSL